MRCLRKFQWIKLFRDNLPEGKGILGFWAKLVAYAAYRNGTSLYCGFENEVLAKRTTKRGLQVGMLRIRRRKKAKRKELKMLKTGMKNL